MAKLLEVFLVFLRLGCTSFGGPVAHLAYFHREFVARRRWLDDAAFGECVALTQLLPGPGSSQTGMLVGWLAAGPLGALAAWIAFTLPSAAAMTAIALLAPHGSLHAGAQHGLLVVAAAVVASAIVTMRTTLAPDTARLAFALAVFALVLALPLPIVTPLAIAAAAACGALLLYGRIPTNAPTLDLRVSRRAGTIVFALFLAAFVALAAWAAHGARDAALAQTLFRVGSLVFGGGHVVLPLLQTQVASAGLVDQRAILSGYAAAQAMPGPLFTIASYVGARALGSVQGALLGTLAIFAPSFFLLVGVAPFYRTLASNERFRAALAGANAGVVGLLAAALVTPILATAIHSFADVVVAIAAFFALHVAKLPAWSVVILGALAGFVLGG
ncbi:MAG: chromate efflux transporter [bacterium]|nr:chromate efflux transporter [bacterium]